MTVMQRRFVVLAPIAVAVVVLILYPLSPSAYFFAVKEYMVIEDLQFLLYTADAVLAALVAVALWRGQGPKALAALYAVAALGLFFVAGEEISWGQEVFERIFPWWPDHDDMVAVNAQGETTLHNLSGMGHVFTQFLFVISVYALLSPFVGAWVRRRWPQTARWVDYLVFPLATVPAMLIAVSFFVALDFLTGPHHDRTPPTGERAFLRFQEVVELNIAFSVLVLLLVLLRSARRKESAVPTGRHAELRTGRSPS